MCGNTVDGKIDEKHQLITEFIEQPVLIWCFCYFYRKEFDQNVWLISETYGFFSRLKDSISISLDSPDEYFHLDFGVNAMH